MAETLTSFEVRTFFPSEIEKFCRLKEVDCATGKGIPVIIDLGRNDFAQWQIGDLQVGKREATERDDKIHKKMLAFKNKFYILFTHNNREIGIVSGVS